MGESFPFSPQGRLLLTADNHNSVNGIREFALAKRAAVAYAPLTRPDLRIDLKTMDEMLAQADPRSKTCWLSPRSQIFPASNIRLR
ncbi:MAG: hypothetical protein IPP41_15370 [Rhodocyclaceae bacterium]|nr:hypothetical protein [Rhodocyclaceae bacterium]